MQRSNWLKESWDMMVLQDWSVVVKNSKARPWLSVEVVGGAGVVVVMDDGREEEGKNLKVREPILIFSTIE